MEVLDYENRNKEHNNNTNHKSKIGYKKLDNIGIKKHLKIMYITSILCLIFWVFSCLIIYKLLVKPSNINIYLFIFIFFIPILSISYHITIQSKIINSSKYIHLEKKRIFDQLKIEKDFAKTLPIIIFGIGIILGRPFTIKMKLSAFPFLILALTFGSIIPYLISLINFKESTIDKLIVSEVSSFCFETYAFSLLFLAVYPPLILSFKKYNKIKL